MSTSRGIFSEGNQLYQNETQTMYTGRASQEPRVNYLLDTLWRTLRGLQTGPSFTRCVRFLDEEFGFDSILSS